MVRVLLAILMVTSIAISLGCGGGGTTSTSTQNPPPSPDFILKVDPPTVSLVAGTSTQFQVKTTSLNSFNGTVSVNAGSLPTGVTTSSALPQNVGATGLTLLVTAASNATTGSLTIPFTLRVTVPSNSCRGFTNNNSQRRWRNLPARCRRYESKIESIDYDTNSLGVGIIRLETPKVPSRKFRGKLLGRGM